MPERDADYARRVWQRLRPRLQKSPRFSWGWMFEPFRLPALPRWAFAPAVAVMVLAAFWVGRVWSRPSPVDVQQMRASLEASLKAELQREFDAKLQAVLVQARGEAARTVAGQFQSGPGNLAATFVSQKDFKDAWADFVETYTRNRAQDRRELPNAWTMPIKARIDMLSTGIRTPVGIKITGDDLATIEEIGTKVERALGSVRGTRSVFAERTSRGYFLDLEWDRDALARYELSVQEAQDVLQSAVGGESVTTTVEGRARYPVNVRYQRDFRADTEALGRVLVPVNEGKAQIPLSQLATIRTVSGPSMIRNEDGLLTGYVYVDLAGRDPQGFVEEADALLRGRVRTPPGYALSWSGQYEAMARVREDTPGG